jgi:predicted acyltransferase
LTGGGVAESRARSLDVMRGLTLALMIVVNMSVGDGVSYGQLLHSTWNGVTLTDLVFPSFLFVVGGALACTLPSYEAIGTAYVTRKVLGRSLAIFSLGVLLYLFPFVTRSAQGHLALVSLTNARIPGVLQRIALCYALAALIVSVGHRRAAWAAISLILPAYALLLGSFGDYTLSGNAVLRLDRWLLGEAHLYHGEGIAFDPEGVLSSLSALTNVLVGYLAVGYVREHGTTYETVATLWLIAALMTGAALLFSDLVPINKKLWTSPYALLSAGVATAAYSATIMLADLRPSGALVSFASPLGRNTLLIYLLSEVGNVVLIGVPVGADSLFEWLWREWFASWAGDKLGGLIYACAYMGGWWVLARALDRRYWYWRL